MKTDRMTATLVGAAYLFSNITTSLKFDGEFGAVFEVTIVLMTISMVLTTCTAPQVQQPTRDAPLTMPNPASVYCLQKGDRLEIRTAADGSQSGVCIFPDGSACDEWDYFRGTCGPAAPESPTPARTAAPASEGQAPGSQVPPGTAEEVAGWWGVIKSVGPGAQFDDCFERQDLGQIIDFGIDSMDPAVKSQIEALRDSGQRVYLYGTLLSNVPDCNGSQILVDHLR